MKTAWLDFIHKIATKIYFLFTKPGQSVLFFEHVYLLKKNIDLTLKEAFNADEKFKGAAKDGFTKALNLKPNFAADFLNRYIDHVFEESDKGEKYVMDKIDEFIIIFKYLDAKDTFEQFYIKKLLIS